MTDTDTDWHLTESERTANVLLLVMAERERQIKKWGGRTGNGIENPLTSNYVRLRVLAEEFGEVAEAMGRPEDGNGKRDLHTELVQVAAVAVAWLEALTPQVMPPEGGDEAEMRSLAADCGVMTHPWKRVVSPTPGRAEGVTYGPDSRDG